MVGYRALAALGSLALVWLVGDGAPRSESAEPPSPLSAPPAPSGAPSSPPSEPALREHADDVVDYTLRARLDPVAHTVHGDGTIRWKNTSSVGVRELWLHLYLNAFKNERSTFLREPAAGSRGSGALHEWGTIDLRALWLRSADGTGTGDNLLGGVELSRDGDEDETDARVPLPRAIAPGETITLDVTWDDKLPSVIERTGYAGSFHFVGQWFPKVARLESDGSWAHFPFHHLAEFYADFGTYDVTLDVPDTFTIGATGPAVESRHDGAWLVERHVQSDVHDFAWTAYDHFRTKEESIAGVDVRVLYPVGFDKDAERELASVRFALPYFAAKYGPYPYTVLTLVHPPEAASEAGGMEYPTLITTGGPWYGAPLTRLIELVTIHEFGHQYFYGLLASNEMLWPFLDEGVNSYAEEDALAAMFGPGSAIAAPGLTVSDAAFQGVVSSGVAHDAPVAQPAYAFATGRLYSGLVYERTGALLETLRRVYGDPAMDRSLGGYARAFRFLHPGPEDLLKSFADGMGGDAAAMLRRGLFEKGWVDYAVAEVVSHRDGAPQGIFDRDGKRETVASGETNAGDYVGWVLVERRGTLRFPVDVILVLGNGERRRVTWDGEGGSTRIPYRGAAPLVAAIVDPDQKVLIDDDMANNHGAAVDAPTHPARHSLELATYAAELFVEALSP
jgi:hypothetical protein